MKIFGIRSSFKIRFLHFATYATEFYKLKRELNSALLQHEIEFNAEKAKELDIAERKMRAEREAADGQSTIVETVDGKTMTERERISKIEQDDILLLPKVDYFGYISEPGSNFKHGAKKVNTNSLEQQFAVTDNWLREENLKLHAQQKVCKKLLKTERVHRKLVEKRMEQFLKIDPETGKNWLDEVLDEDPKVAAENKRRLAPSPLEAVIEEEFSDESSSESEVSVANSEAKRLESLNQIRDNFLRLFFKFDSKNVKKDMEHYLKYRDVPPARKRWTNAVNKLNAGSSIYSGSRRSSILSTTPRAAPILPKLGDNQLGKSQSFVGSNKNWAAVRNSVQGRRSSVIAINPVPTMDQRPVEDDDDKMQKELQNLQNGLISMTRRASIADVTQLHELDPAAFLAEISQRRSSIKPTKKSSLHENFLPEIDTGFNTAKRTRYLRWGKNSAPKFERELTFEKILECED